MTPYSHNDSFHLDNILQSIKNTQIHESAKAPEFTKIRAIVFEIAVIGEAASHISKDIRNKYTEIPWNDIINTRHRIIHEYDQIDYELVWKIVEVHLPELEKQVNNILKDL